MKPKINVSDELAKLCKKFEDDSDFLAVYKNGNQVEIALMGNDDDIADCLSKMIEDHINGTKEEGINRVAGIVITAVEKLLAENNKESLMLSMRFARSAMSSLLNMDGDDDGEEEDDDEPDCEHCEHLKDCSLDSAIATRKRLGIRKPKNAKKVKE